jgi:hypothetical protein
MRFRLILSFFAPLWLVTASTAATLYVNASNPAPVAPYTDWSTAATNIQDAVNAAAAGDLILVTNGFYQYGSQAVYGATNRVAVALPMTVQSVGGPGATTISGGPGVRCVYLTNGAVLAGFTLTNGVTLTSGDALMAQSGGGVWCESSNVIVTNCALVGNSANQFGGGAYEGTLINCALTGNSCPTGGGGAYQARLTNCTLSGNLATGYFGNGAGIGAGAFECTLDNCTLTNNTASSSGGGAFGGTLNDCTLTGNTSLYSGGGGADSAILNRCVLSSNVNLLGPGIGGGAGGGADQSTLNSCALIGNQATYGGGVAFATLNNCTLVGNTAGVFGGGAFESTLNNCIVYFNLSVQNANFDPSSTLNYCCTTPLPSTGSGNFTSDPQLDSDSHISTRSPCRGAGSVAYATGTDIDGETWLNPPSVGCNEYISGSVTGALSVAVTADYTNVAIGFHANFAAIIGGRVSNSTWDFGDGLVLSNQPFASHAWAAAGDYLVILTAYNESNPGGVSAEVPVHVAAQPVYYVALGNGLPSAPYSSWAKAATNIQDAVDAASVAGALVLVSNGVYQAGGRVADGLPNRVVVPLPLIVLGINGASVTTIRGDNGIRCLDLATGASLKGFTLTNGSAPGSGANGGSVYCQSSGAVLSNCVIAGNSTESVGAVSDGLGGGVFQGTLYHCTLTGNYSGASGGGACEAVLNNCTLNGNSAYTYGGAAVYSLLNNCLVTSNLVNGDMDSSQGGGAAYSTLNNCTLAANSSINPGSSGAYQSTLNNCIVTDGDYLCTLNYCFTGPPLFVNQSGGNFRLQSKSPCINTGNNLYVVGTTDLDGRPRIVGGTVDVGAYEFQGPGTGEFIGWLQQYGQPTDGSADFVDTDHDGMNNWQEWIAGTNPTNAASVLKLLTLTPSLGSNVTINWSSVNTRSYFVQRANALGFKAPTPFSVMQSNIPGLSGTTSWTDTNAPAAPAYYRVGVQ